MKKLSRHSGRRAAAKKSKSAVSWWVVLLVALPILLWAAMSRTSYVPKADLSGTPLNAFQYALKLSNEGVNDTYVRVTPSVVLSQDPFTVEAWIKIPKPSGGTYIRNYPILIQTKPQSPADAGYLFRLDAEVQESTGQYRPIFRALLANWTDWSNMHLRDIVTYGPMLEPDVWHHIAVTARSEGNYCYLDMYTGGQPVGTVSRYKDACRISTQNPTDLFVGRRLDSEGGISGYYLTGEIDDVRISSGIAYMAPFTPPVAPLAGVSGATRLLYHFDTDSTSVTDYSGNTQTGSVMGNNFSYVPSGVVPLPTLTPTATPGPTNTPTPVIGSKPVITTGVLPVAKAGNRYEAQITGTDPDRNERLTMTATGLPPGLTVSDCRISRQQGSGSRVSCRITGIPTGPGTVYMPVFTLKDSAGNSVTRQLKLTVRT